MKPLGAHMRFSYQEKQTLGYLTFEKFPNERFFMMELPWKNNQRGISCIPEEIYDIIPWNSPKFGKCFKIVSQGHKEVIGRADVLQHPANFSSQLRGCQSPGLGIADINKDGLHDVTASKPAMDRLLELCPEGYTLQITSPYEFNYHG